MFCNMNVLSDALPITRMWLVNSKYRRIVNMDALAWAKQSSKITEFILSCKPYNSINTYIVESSIVSFVTKLCQALTTVCKVYISYSLSLISALKTKPLEKLIFIQVVILSHAVSRV